MILTESLKKQIDEMDYQALLNKWRFASLGDPLFQGESGDYFAKVMRDKREAGIDHVGASKAIGWS
jgi:hypothetical protein